MACSMPALYSPLIAGNRSLQLIQTNFKSLDRIALVTPFVGAEGNRAADWPDEVGVLRSNRR